MQVSVANVTQTADVITNERVLEGYPIAAGSLGGDRGELVLQTFRPTSGYKL